MHTVPVLLIWLTMTACGSTYVGVIFKNAAKTLPLDWLYGLNSILPFSIKSFSVGIRTSIPVYRLVTVTVSLFNMDFPYIEQRDMPNSAPLMYVCELLSIYVKFHFCCLEVKTNGLL